MTLDEKFCELIVNENAWVVTLDGMRFVSSASSTIMAVESGEMLMNDAVGAITAVMGQVMDGIAFSTSVIL